MREDIVTSRIDPRDGFTLHDVEIGQFLNSENIRRNDQRQPLIHHILKIPMTGPRPGYISTLLVYE